MDDKKITEPEKPVAQPSATTTKPTGPVAPHISNPFTTAINGIKKVFRYNTNALIGTVLFNLVIGVLMLMTLGVMVGAILAFVLKNGNAQSIASVFPPQVVDLANTLSEPAIYASAIIGFMLLVIFASLLQAIQLKLVAASSASQTIRFGELFKQGIRRVWPLIGLTALVILVCIVAALALVLLGLAIGPIIFILALIVGILAIYFGMRISFAAFSVVDEKLGPIAAIKRSLALSKGHFAEIIGIAFATSIIATVPTSLLQLLASVGGPAHDGLQLLSAVVGLILSTLVIAGVAERFTQLRNIKDGVTSPTRTHFSNYLAIVVFILLSILFNAFTPKEDRELNPYFDSAEFNEHDNPQQTPNNGSFDAPVQQQEPTYNLN